MTRGWAQVCFIAAEMRARARSMGHGDLPRWLEARAGDLERAADETLPKTVARGSGWCDHPALHALGECGCVKPEKG